MPFTGSYALSSDFPSLTHKLMCFLQRVARGLLATCSIRWQATLDARGYGDETLGGFIFLPWVCQMRSRADIVRNASRKTTRHPPRKASPRLMQYQAHNPNTSAKST